MKNKSLKSTKNRSKIFFVNPMGRGTLKNYDISIINHLNDNDIFYITDKIETNQLKDITTINLYNYANKGKFGKILFYIICQLKLIRLSLVKKPEVIHFQWLKIPVFDFLVIRFLIRNNFRVVFTAHNILPHNSGTKYAKIFSKIYKELDAIIVHSEVTKDELIKDLNTPKEKVHIIPHGLFDISNIEEVEIDNCMQDYKSELSLEGKIVFSLMGNLTKYKGIELLKESWDHGGFYKNQKVHLIIAGKGEKEIVKGFESFENVTVYNYSVSDLNFVSLIRLSNFVLFPYLKISQSGLLFTVLKQKRKVIVSNKGGLPEPFQFGNIGFILKDLSPEGLSHIINNAIVEANEYPKEEVWAAIHKYYDWEDIGKKTTNLYNSFNPKS